MCRVKIKTLYLLRTGHFPLERRIDPSGDQATGSYQENSELDSDNGPEIITENIQNLHKINATLFIDHISQNCSLNPHQPHLRQSHFYWQPFS